MTSANGTSCSARHELHSRAFLFIVSRSARYPQMPRFLQFLREFWPMPLPLMNHCALALFAQRTRIPTSARSIGFCVIWVCIDSSSSPKHRKYLVAEKKRISKKKSSPMGFEPMRTLYNGLAGHRLNHSAKATCVTRSILQI